MSTNPSDIRHGANSVAVWDRPVRLFHWTLVIAFGVAWFADAEWIAWHFRAGYLVFALLAFRLSWGFIGTRYSRFDSFVYRPATVLGYLRDVFTLRAHRFKGHNPAGGAMIIALLGTILLTTTTGILLYGSDAWLGPMAWLMKNASSSTIAWLDIVHGFSARLTVALVGLHLLGVLWESLLHRENLVSAMINGRKLIDPGKPPVDERQ